MAILAFFSASFPVSALASGFWHFSWVPSAKYKQGRALKVAAVVPGVGTLQHRLKQHSIAHVFPCMRHTTVLQLSFSVPAQPVKT